MTFNFKNIFIVTILSIFISSTLKAQNSELPKSTIASSDFTEIKGVINPEDIIVLPNSNWLIVSGMAPNSGLHYINTKSKTIHQLIAPRAKSPQEKFKGSIQPNKDELQAHGISFYKTGRKKGLLYVVNHGGKIPFSDLANSNGSETVEIFEVNYKKSEPLITWLGNIKLPDGLVGNAVVSDKNGAVYVTVALHPGFEANDFWTDKKTGAIYRWSPDSPSFQKIQGTELTGNNGLEISKDGKALYVVSMRGISKFSNTNPAVLLEENKIGYGLGDNIHWSNNELIIAASRLENCPQKGPDFSCMKGFHVSKINPKTLEIKPMIFGENPNNFGGASVGVIFKNTLWLGSFYSQGVFYSELPSSK